MCPTWRGRSAARCLQLSATEFVLAADRPRRAEPAASCSCDILPNIETTLIVFAPLMMALNMITESRCRSCRSACSRPHASWGTIIEDGQSLLYTRPLVAIAPGVAIVLTVLALNVLGDGVRDALDPRAKLRLR